MLPRKPLAVALLLLAATALPQWLWLGAHVLEDHGHEHEAAAGHGAEQAGFAMALVHGHQHPDGVPDHEHHLLPSTPLRPDPPRDLQAPALDSRPAPEPGRVLLSGASLWRGETRLSGSSPPRLHLLCVLLI